MAVLLLRLAGVLQSWGSESKFETRRTEKYPTKSGVIGMIASSLGRNREESVEDLCCLKFGIRTDYEGRIIQDYHTVTVTEKPYITYRDYISDAVFLAGLESDDIDKLNDISYALKHPAHPLFLGRCACPPSIPLVLGIRNATLIDALSDEPWQLPEWRQAKIKNDDERKLRILIDSDCPDGFSVIRDVPQSFNSIRRKYGWRNVEEHYVTIEGTDKIVETEHDAMAELR